MNARTCQLCGKALSRFTVGSGGDFCSREHRNQFRLRLGMDRLMEANKVASLMRRRENAKTIPTTQLVRDLNVQPRMAPVVRMPLRQPGQYVIHPLRAALSTPAIVSHLGRPRTPAPAATPLPANARASESQAIRIRSKRPLVALRHGGFPARVAAAGPAARRALAATIADLRREAGELRLSAQRLHIGGNGIQVKTLRVNALHCQEPQAARKLTNTADRGRDLRVSGGIGFRLSTPRVRSIEFARPRTQPLVRLTTARGLVLSTQPKQGSAMAAGVIRITIQKPAGPKGPAHAAGTGFQWPDARRAGGEAARGAVPVTRACDVKWMAPTLCPPEFHYSNGAAGFHPAVAPSLSQFEPPPYTIRSDYRATSVAFQPQEMAFQCPTALYGTLLTGMHFGAAPVRKVESAPATVEEHFESGLRNWMGGIEDWKVDVAGVRPGSLALFTPSLELPNYAFEFLARIELKGISWVFRAANLQDYYQATLAVAPGGGYEFRRSTAIGGLAEGATVRMVSPAAGVTTGKTAVTVRTRVSGSEFTVSLDGQTVDTWTDARLTGGGIGFVGAPEERARLYWVKVTPLGHISKEYSKR